MTTLLQFTPIALSQYYDWAGEDRDTFLQLQYAIGKLSTDEGWMRMNSAQLQGPLQGYRSVRFMGDHRLVFRYEKGFITIVSCKLFYR